MARCRSTSVSTKCSARRGAPAASVATRCSTSCARRSTTTSSTSSARSSTTSASSEDDLRRRVHEQLHAALAQERAPLSAADKAQLIQDVSDDILGYGPIDRLLKDEDVTEVMVQRPRQRSTSSATASSRRPTPTFVDETHLRRIIDKIVGQVGRRIDESTPMVRRPPPRRLPRQRGDPPAGHRRPVPHHPEVLQGPVPDRRPHPLRHAQRRTSARFLAGLRGRPAQHHRLRRYRHR